MENSVININNDIKDKFLYFFLFIVVFCIIQFSPSFLEIVQPDSDSYINNSDYRKSLYSLIIQSLDFLNFDLFLFQKIMLTSSLICIFYSLRFQKIKFIYCVFFILIVSINAYYTSFTKTILTEALFFSFINFSIALFLLKEKNSNFLNFLSGLSFGFLFSIKSVGMVLGLIFLLVLLIFQLRDKKFKSIIIIFTGFLIFPITEYHYFYSKNKERSSVLPLSILGKIFIISGSDSFNYLKFPNESHKLLDTASKISKGIKQSMESMKNPYLKFELSSDYEVLAQYQILKSEINTINEEYRKNSEVPILKDHKVLLNEIGIIMLKEYPLEYAKISFSHYLGLWSIGAKQIFLENYLIKTDKKLPFLEMIELSNNKYNSLDRLFLISVFIFFLFLFLFFSILTLFTFFVLIKTRNPKKDFLLELFIFSAQSYLFAIAFTNIAIPRYFIAIYPIILVSLIMISDDLISFIKKKLY